MAGRVEQLLAVVEAVGRPRTVQRRLLRRFLAELRSCLQLPGGTLQYANHYAHHHQQQQQQTFLGASFPQHPIQPGSSSSANSSSSSSSDGVLAAAMALMEAPQCSDMLSSLLTQSYLAVSMPGEYLGAVPRPAQPAVHIPSLHSLTQLLLQLAERAELPPGARCKDLPLFRMYVRTVLQSCDLYLMHALLLFMQRHGAEVMVDMPEDAMGALGAEAEMLQGAAQG
jgi:hypothetical protein